MLSRSPTLPLPYMAKNHRGIESCVLEGAVGSLSVRKDWEIIFQFFGRLPVKFHRVGLMVGFVYDLKFCLIGLDRAVRFKGVILNSKKALKSLA